MEILADNYLNNFFEDEEDELDSSPTLIKKPIRVYQRSISK